MVGSQARYLGEGSGAGAQVITVTVNFEATATDCVFQGAAEVVTN